MCILVAITAASFFVVTDHRHKEMILNQVVVRQVHGTGEHIHQNGVEFVVTRNGQVLEDDVLQLNQFLLHMVVTGTEDPNVVLRIRRLSVQEVLHIGKHLMVLVVHVTMDLLDVFVKIRKDQVRHAFFGLRLDQGLRQPLPQLRQTVTQEKLVGRLQVVNQGRQGNLLGTELEIFLIRQQVHHCQEGRHIHSIFLTHFSDGPIAHPQGDAKTHHHQQHGITTTNQIFHAIVCVVTSYVIHKKLFFSKTSGANPNRSCGEVTDRTYSQSHGQLPRQNLVGRH